MKHYFYILMQSIILVMHYLLCIVVYTRHSNILKYHQKSKLPSLEFCLLWSPSHDEDRMVVVGDQLYMGFEDHCRNFR